MKRRLITMCFTVLAVSAALAQAKKDVPPPPKPADEGPSLEVTLKFIQDKMNDIGPVIWTEYYHDNSSGADWTNTFGEETRDFIGDAPTCRIRYHRSGANLTLEQPNSKSKFPPTKPIFEYEVSLKDIDDIVVIPELEGEIRAHAGDVNPEFRKMTPTNVTPPVFSLVVTTNHTITWGFVENPEASKKLDAMKKVYFKIPSGNMADRIAKAIQHAAELCSDSSKNEPF